MQTIQSISNSSGKPVILLPLTTIILITMIKDVFEDWKRHKSDNEENCKKVMIGSTSLGFKQEKWEDVRVGTIIKVYEDEYFPADFLVLRTSDPKGVYWVIFNKILKGLGMCFIETKNLDGETNLKHKFVHKDLINFYGNDSDVLYNINYILYLINIISVLPQTSELQIWKPKPLFVHIHWKLWDWD